MLSNTFNYLTIILLISYLLYFQKIDLKISFSLAILSILPLFIIGTIIPMTIVSDSIQYTYFAQIHRYNFGLGIPMTYEDLGSLARHIGHPVDYISFVYALVPIPFIDNIRSLGFSNKFLLILMIASIYSNKIRKDNFIIFVLILYPSIIFYSSVGLKDTLVLITMIFLAYYIIEKK